MGLKPFTQSLTVQYLQWNDYIIHRTNLDFILVFLKYKKSKFLHQSLKKIHASRSKCVQLNSLPTPLPFLSVFTSQTMLVSKPSVCPSCFFSQHIVNRTMLG